MDVSTSTLRTARVVAELGSISAGARALGYTQSAVSRQISALERDVGHLLFARTTGGVKLTREGATLLRAASDMLARLDASASEIAGTTPDSIVRVGIFPAAGATLLPAAVASLRQLRPELQIVSRHGSTPALIRGLRSGAIDLGVISQRAPYRAPDDETPALELEQLFETELVVGAATNYFSGSTVSAAELLQAPWIAPASSTDDPQIGTWPGLPGRPQLAHRSNDWLVRLRLAAGGAGVTSMPGTFLTHLVPGLQTWRVADLPPELRRISLARASGKDSQNDIISTVMNEFLRASESFLDELGDSATA